MVMTPEKKWSMENGARKVRGRVDALKQEGSVQRGRTLRVPMFGGERDVVEYTITGADGTTHTVYDYHEHDPSRSEILGPRRASDPYDLLFELWRGETTKRGYCGRGSYQGQYASQWLDSPVRPERDQFPREASWRKISPPDFTRYILEVLVHERCEGVFAQHDPRQATA